MRQQPRLFSLPKILDDRGNLSFLQSPEQVPFDVKRVYWIYDVPADEVRGSHAFAETREFVIALSGSFEVVLHDGMSESCFMLHRSDTALLIPSLYWRTIRKFSTNAVAFILASTPFSQSDYIRDFDVFLQVALNGRREE